MNLSKKIKCLGLLVIMTIPSLVLGKSIDVEVSGMVCAFCAQGIEKTFKKEKSVEDVKVDLDSKIVHIKLKEKTDMADEKIKSLITDAGYDVKEIKR